MPTKPTLPTLKSLADLPDVPSPVLALVGAGDAAAEVARELPAKLAAVDPKTLDPREREVRIDLSTLDPRKIDLTALSAKLDPRNIDTAALTATGLQWAAKGQEAYETLVARGESVVTKARATEPAEAPVVAEPPAKKTAQSPASTAKKTAAKPATASEAPEASDQA